MPRNSKEQGFFDHKFGNRDDIECGVTKECTHHELIAEWIGLDTMIPKKCSDAHTMWRTITYAKERVKLLIILNPPLQPITHGPQEPF